MPAGPEFHLIEKYFSPPDARGNGVVLGVGDDGAVLRVPAEKELVVTTDTLVAGVHYPAATAPADVGHKALAVNLSDLAAMGAEPAWATLALTLSAADEKWLSAFADGLFSLAKRFGVTLVGGDTTRGPLTLITLHLLGLVPRGEALYRGGARTGDLVYVTGTLGDAALALRLLEGGERVPEALRCRLDRPEPRVAEGVALRGLASACIDISDGLLADLGHILEASGVGARLELERLPLSGDYQTHVKGERDPWEAAVSGGDDYELCFTVPPGKAEELERSFARSGWVCHQVGVIEEQPGLRCRLPDGTVYAPRRRGYDHFAPL